MINTIGELIAELQKYPSDSEIGIDDADTGWHMRISHLYEEKGRVLIEGAGYNRTRGDLF